MIFQRIFFRTEVSALSFLGSTIVISSAIFVTVELSAFLSFLPIQK